MSGDRRKLSQRCGDNNIIFFLNSGNQIQCISSVCLCLVWRMGSEPIVYATGGPPKRPKTCFRRR